MKIDSQDPRESHAKQLIIKHGGPHGAVPSAECPPREPAAMAAK